MTLFWTRTWDALSGALFPTACVACGNLVSAHDPPLCQECWDRLPLIAGPVCTCGSPLPGADGEVCGRCRRGRSPILEGASLGAYAGPLRDCVVALKYGGRHRTATRLSVRLLESGRCRHILSASDVILGVPLHPDRERGRGFNQADLLARALARNCGLPVSRGLARTRNTRSQTALSAGDRRRNVRAAFAVRPDPLLEGAAVALVDDVTTTGATLRECAAVLLAGGAREVRSITVARAE
ncbi:MAG TPA: ComF family protein [Vicinamibacteria bacterium]|nr:ComF family protein [Vicinamibacteria bacterium]